MRFSQSTPKSQLFKGILISTEQHPTSRHCPTSNSNYIFGSATTLHTVWNGEPHNWAGYPRCLGKKEGCWCYSKVSKKEGKVEGRQGKELMSRLQEIWSTCENKCWGWKDRSVAKSTWCSCPIPDSVPSTMSGSSAPLQLQEIQHLLWPSQVSTHTWIHEHTQIHIHTHEYKT